MVGCANDYRLVKLARLFSIGVDTADLFVNRCGKGIVVENRARPVLSSQRFALGVNLDMMRTGCCTLRPIKVGLRWDADIAIEIHVFSR